MAPERRSSAHLSGLIRILGELGHVHIESMQPMARDELCRGLMVVEKQPGEEVRTSDGMRRGRG